MALIGLNKNYKYNLNKSSQEQVIKNSIIKKELLDDNSYVLMIGKGVTINGNIKTNNTVKIQGSVIGDVDCNSIIIDEEGNIKGKVNTENMTIDGKAEGEIKVKNLLKIKSKGKVNGNIVYGNIQIDNKGKLIGKIDSKEFNSKNNDLDDWKAL